MCSSPKIIQELICSNGAKLDISQSNDKSPIIKVVNEIIGNAQKERFYDTLLNNYDTLKLITNPVIDMGKTDQGILYLFSSKLEIDDGIKPRQEHSTQCKYRLDLKLISLLSQIKIISQSETNLQESSKELIFHINDMHGYAINDQVTKGFSDRTKLILLSGISHEIYENIIDECIRIGIGAAFQHICWCKKCTDNPYAIFIHGQNIIHEEIKCPICNEPLYTTRFIALLPEFEPLLEHNGGFLPPLIGWHLTKEGVAWTADVTIDQHEYADILLKRNNQYYLIESKIWSRDKHERGLNGVIKKAIDQAIKHVKFWEENNIEIKKVAIITNQFDSPMFQQYIESSLKEKKQMIGDIRIMVYPLKQISKFIKEFIGE